jgi:hypothetical protein
MHLNMLKAQLIQFGRFVPLAIRFLQQWTCVRRTIIQPARFVRDRSVSLDIGLAVKQHVAGTVIILFCCLRRLRQLKHCVNLPVHLCYRAVTVTASLAREQGFDSRSSLVDSAFHALLGKMRSS